MPGSLAKHPELNVLKTCVSGSLAVFADLNSRSLVWQMLLNSVLFNDQINAWQFGKTSGTRCIETGVSGSLAAFADFNSCSLVWQILLTSVSFKDQSYAWQFGQTSGT
jgi:hypothetical protein